MEELHAMYGEFRNEMPEIFACYEKLGQTVHNEGGPLDERSRALVKLSISAATGHINALRTHIGKARIAGLSEEEIRHALVLLIPTIGFPSFMRAYSVFKKGTV